ncbi:hypothetical protein [Caudoviricetes sp.]|nr:hypothetical protein [Caudoviricetes sp.]UOF81516.1 hypothetical protein [Caudoviricetes sp.]
MPFAILPALQWLGAGFWSFASSRAGQIIIAATVAWFWAGARAGDHWRAVIAAEKVQAEAAYRAEVARQERAAQEIAAAATARAEDDAALERELRAQIDAFNAQESQNVPASSPQPAASHSRDVIDRDFERVVRQFDAAARRPTKSPRAAR